LQDLKSKLPGSCAIHWILSFASSSSSLQKGITLYPFLSTLFLGACAAPSLRFTSFNFSSPSFQPHQISPTMADMCVFCLSASPIQRENIRDAGCIQLPLHDAVLVPKLLCN
jgi:hypothetical protein